jgi:hypothetical protein
MRKLVIGLVAVAALAVAGPVSAGGWATAGLGPPDDGISAGDTWKAEVTILQHGQTPLVGVQPAVIIRNLDNGAERRFAAEPTDKPGVYLANVKFPSGGEWRYFVDDGFTQYGGRQTHSFSTIQVAGGSGGGGSGLDLPVWPLAIAALLAVAVVLGLFARRARPRTAPAPH